MNTKLRKTIAIIALVFMAIFSVTLVIVFVNPDLCNGVFRYLALISGLLGIGLFLVIKFVLKDKETPEYLPKGNADGNTDETSAENEAKDGAAEETEKCEENTESESDGK